SVLRWTETTRLSQPLKKLVFPYFIIPIGQKPPLWEKRNGSSFSGRYSTRKKKQTVFSKPLRQHIFQQKKWPQKPKCRPLLFLAPCIRMFGICHRAIVG